VGEGSIDVQNRPLTPEVKGVAVEVGDQNSFGRLESSNVTLNKKFLTLIVIFTQITNHSQLTSPRTLHLSLSAKQAWKHPRSITRPRTG